MGKKNKKRFNQVLDIDFQFSNTSVLDGGDPPDVKLSKEKIEEVQRIRSELPSAPQAVRLEEEVSRIPETGPFRMTLLNVPFQAQRRDIYDFLSPIVPANVSIDESGQNRGFCHVEFASKADMVGAMEKNGECLQGRRISMRIADPDDARMAFGNSYNSYNRRQDFRPQAEQPTGWVRRSLPKSEPSQQTPQKSTASPAAPKSERPVFIIKPRSKPLNESDRDAIVESERNAAIFGAAKPVDIVAKERELEELMRKASLQDGKTGGRKPEEGDANSSTTQKRAPPKQQQPAGPRQNAWSKPLVSKKD